MFGGCWRAKLNRWRSGYGTCAEVRFVVGRAGKGRITRGKGVRQDVE